MHVVSSFAMAHVDCFVLLVRYGAIFMFSMCIAGAYHSRIQTTHEWPMVAWSRRSECMIIPVQNGIVPGMTLHYVLRSMSISLAHQNESMDVILPLPQMLRWVFFPEKGMDIKKKRTLSPNKAHPMPLSLEIVLIQYVIIRPISGPDLNSIPILFGACWAAALLRNIKAEASTGWAETIPWISMELGRPKRMSETRKTYDRLPR